MNNYRVFPLLDKYVAVGTSPEGSINIIRLNEMGKDIFKMYIKGQSVQVMVSRLLPDYDATEQELTTIVRNFVSELSQKNL